MLTYLRRKNIVASNKPALAVTPIDISAFALNDESAAIIKIPITFFIFDPYYLLINIFKDFIHIKMTLPTILNYKFLNLFFMLYFYH